MDKRLQDLFNEEELLELSANLVKIPGHSASPRWEADVAEYILEVFKKEGIEAYLQPVEGERCNVIATIRGDGTKKSLMLNGHIDTVPVFGMDNPYSAEIRDGIMHGRGTCDMKCGIAGMMYTLMLIHRAKIQLGGDLVFAGMIDEESGSSKGAWHVIKNGPITDYAIVGEPSDLSPIVTHKGIDYFKMEFRGKAAHSSKIELGANAIYAGADFVTAIRETLIPQYQAKEYPHLGAASVNVAIITGCSESNKDFLDKKVDTFNATVPDLCDLYVDVRWTPDQSIDGILKDLRNLAEVVGERNPGVKIDVQYVPLPRPALPISSDPVIIEAIKNGIIAEIGTEKAVPMGGSFFTDASILAQGNIPSVVFGPGAMSMGLHTVNEHIVISQIYDAAKVYASAALEICGKDSFV